MTDDAAVLWIADRLRWLVTGEKVLFTDPMVRQVVRNASDDRIFVGALSQHRQMLADLYVADVRGDRMELTANVSGCIRLQ